MDPRDGHREWLSSWQLLGRPLVQGTKTPKIWLMLLCRQIWLARTTLPDGIKRELINIALEPGSVFHADSLSLLERAEHSLPTRESAESISAPHT